jgi:hypothetical protein
MVLPARAVRSDIRIASDPALNAVTLSPTYHRGGSR